MNYRRILFIVVAVWVLFLAFISGRNSVSRAEASVEAAEPGEVTLTLPNAARLRGEEGAAWLFRLRRLAARETSSDRHFAEVVKDWIAQDPEEAIGWLARGPETEDLLPWLVNLWSRQEPEQAGEWVKARKSSESYRAAAQGLVLGLSEFHPEAAFDWIATVSDPDLRLKLWTLAGYERYRRDPTWDGAELEKADLPQQAREALQAAWKDRFTRQAGHYAREIVSLLAQAKDAGVSPRFDSVTGAIEQVLREAEAGGILTDSFLPWKPLTEAEIGEIEAHLSMEEQGEIVYTPR